MARELLIVLRPQHEVSVSYGGHRVTQTVSRVALVEGATKQELQALDGVEAVLEPGERLPEAVVETLTPAETTFAEAYARRSRLEQRPGEGLAWDAEGFSPPDRPDER